MTSTSSQTTEPPAIAVGSGAALTIRRQSDAPLRRWIRRAIVGDVASVAVAVCLAGIARFGVSATAGLRAEYVALAVIVIVAWPMLGALSGTYELRTSLFAVEELRRVLRAGIALAASLGMTHFLFKLSLSRGYVALLIPLVVTLTAVWRLLLRRRTSNWMEHGQHHHKAVAVGPVAEIAELCRQLKGRGRSPIEVVAFVADDLDDEDPVPAPLEHLRRLPNRDAINTLPAQGVAIDLLVRAGRPHAHEIAAMSQRAHDLGVRVAIAPHKHDTAANVAVGYVPLGSTPLLMVETPTMRPTAAFVKAGLDRAMAAGFLVVLSPLLVSLALLIALLEGRPILFRQQRVGRDGMLFWCLKFRTMHRDAEDQLSSLYYLNEATGPLFKLRDDPRVTKTGRWMRRHSLDELPQLLNVLRGEMSIVGPRPALPEEVATFDQRIARRLLVKPGITGLWQIEGRSDLSWDDGVYLDLMYVDHWSPLLDWVIIARTVKTVIRPAGAY